MVQNKEIETLVVTLKKEGNCQVSSGMAYKGQTKSKQFFKPMFPPKNERKNSSLLL